MGSDEGDEDMLADDGDGERGAVGREVSEDTTLSEREDGNDDEAGEAEDEEEKAHGRGEDDASEEEEELQLLDDEVVAGDGEEEGYSEDLNQLKRPGDYKKAKVRRLGMGNCSCSRPCVSPSGCLLTAHTQPSSQTRASSLRGS